MKLVDNAHLVIKHSLTIKLAALAVVLQLLGQIWPAVSSNVQALVDPKIFNILSVIFTGAAMLARVIHQEVLHPGADGIVQVENDQDEQT